MECKYLTAEFFQSHISELIDTLWNVNEKKKAKKRWMQHELIDTLWNVNYGGYGMGKPLSP